MNHVIEFGNFMIRIRDDGKVERRPLRLANVFCPTRVRIGWIDTQSDDFDVALFEFRFQPRRFAQFSRANRREVLWMGKQTSPAVANPVVKADLSLGGFRREIRRHIS